MIYLKKKKKIKLKKKYKKKKRKKVKKKWDLFRQNVKLHVVNISLKVK